MEHGHRTPQTDMSSCLWGPPIPHGSENRLTRNKDFPYDDAILNERSVIGVMPCQPLSGRSKQSSRIPLSSSDGTSRSAMPPFISSPEGAITRRASARLRKEPTYSLGPSQIK